MKNYFLLGIVLLSSIISYSLEKDVSFNYLVIGDWGGLPFYPYKTYIEEGIAKKIGVVAETLNSKLVLALGDNFYFDGVKNVDDKRFQETYENVFTAKSLKVLLPCCFSINYSVIVSKKDFYK